MEDGYRFLDAPRACSYLPLERARMEYELVDRLSPGEYLGRMNQGWRRFGHTLFRPRCKACNACRPLRIDVARFRPDRSQKRAFRANQGEIRLEIARPSALPENLDLHRRYHESQSERKGWPEHDDDPFGYAQTFVHNPFATQEWRYFLGDRLVGVGYVDDVPTVLSAVYFFHDPALRERSLGTFNVLTLIGCARDRGYPYVYLGYYVEGCRSMAYKARFRVNQLLGEDGSWRDFLA